MSLPTRETIITALFDLIRGAVYIGTNTTVFTTAERRLKLWDQVKLKERPALFLVEHAETHVQKAQGVPTVRTLEVKLFIYLDSKDQNAIPDQAVNAVIDAIDSVTGGVLKPDTGKNTQTLGGLVQHVWIEGDILKDPGDLDGDGLIIIPIKILIP